MTYKRNFDDQSLNIHGMMKVLYSLLREDVVRTNSGCYQWTTKTDLEGFFTFS